MLQYKKTLFTAQTTLQYKKHFLLFELRCKINTYNYILIPSPNINIDTSINAAFKADKLNAANSYLDITDC